MSPSSASEAPLIGRVIAGRYKVERRIARGGMGVVYVAQHLRLHRPVVFKVLSEHLVDDERAVARFEQEALGLSRLNHPNVVTVHDFGVEEGVTYIVMEFVDGLTLSELLQRDGVMTFERFLPLGAQIIEAIRAAHDEEIVHRDIKPANIMVVAQPGHPDRADQVKVLDFGLARLTSSSLDITKDNLVGTVTYVAPEVVTGQRAGKAADVYALGILFYFILTGRKPFKAEDDIAVLYKHVHDAPQPMGELLPAGHGVPDRFVALVHRCLSKDPAQRPGDGRALLEALGQIVEVPGQGRLAQIVEVPGPGRLAAGGDERATLPGPVASAPVAHGVEHSVDLSSMALRDRPNSRWGLPLIALCVFIAGVAAVVMVSRGGSEAEAQPADAPAEAPDGAPPNTPANTKAVTPTDVPNDVPADTPAEAPTGKTGADLDNKLRTAPAEQAPVSGSSDTDSGPSDKAPSPAPRGDNPKPLFAPADSEPELLGVDDKSGGGLLPVD